MKNTINQSPRCAKLSLLFLSYGTVIMVGAALVAAQSRIIRPSTQTNSSGPASRRPHIATLRSNDSPDGSRVAVTSDQSLNNYEAYRRGDRFYLRIPAADMPRAEATRGRGFADVKTQRTGDSTVVSFRLQPGATAHVEQRSNRLEVVFTVPASTASANTNRLRSNSETDASRKSNVNKSNSKSTSGLKTSTAPANQNSNSSGQRPGSLASANADNRKTGSALTPSNSSSKSNPTPLASPKPSPTAKPSATLAPKAASVATASPLNQPSPVVRVQPRGTFWAQMKDRVSYWILLAQLNPLPVAIGAGILFLVVGLFISQRRRARGPRRVRPSRADSRETKTAEAAAATSVQPAGPSQPEPVASTGAVAAVTAGVVAATATRDEVGPEAESAKVDSSAASTPIDGPRRERIARVADEVKKLTAGGDYDQTVIGSDDRETRQLVGAELLAALVGRNVPRRERAREAFMKHGYFDDATHDLRIADSSNERAAAARRLSFVRDREAIPHLIGALDDSAPDVRRAAVEALMDLRDPAAIGPLNSLMQTENDRKVPRTLIKHAIDACATSSAADDSAPVASSLTPPTTPETSSQPVDSEREVIEL
jgi:hypothetical protein